MDQLVDSLGSGLAYFCCFVPVFFVIASSVFVWIRRDGIRGLWDTDAGFARFTTAPEPPPSPAPEAIKGPVGLELLRKDDPGFDKADLYDRVSWMVAKVHHAITDQDLERVRPYLDATAILALERRIESMRSNRWREVFRGLRVERLTACTVQRADSRETVRLLVTIRAAYAVIDEISGRYVRSFGDGETAESLQEYWTISRQMDPHPAPAPVFKKCPNCGAPIAEGHRWACSYCGADLRGPEREWMVLSIEAAPGA